jgi:vesicle-fusing ATPase
LAIEVPLPTQEGRLEILKIHTRKMETNHYMAPDIDLQYFAQHTANYTGAEIESLVNSAISFAIAREMNMESLNEIQEGKKDITPIVCRSDFERALNDIHPMFGNVSQEIQRYVANPFIMWGNEIPLMRDQIEQKIRNVKHGNILSISLSGSANTGKTKFISLIAHQSQIQCIKMVTPDLLLTKNDRTGYLISEFDKCQSAEKSILILDSLERIIEWSNLTSQYNNRVLQTIMILLRRQPEANKSMCIIITCYDQTILKRLELFDLIDVFYEMPEHMTNSDVNNVSQQMNIETFQNTLDSIDEIQVSKFFRLFKSC